jgi:hypothetical protein
MFETHSFEGLLADLAGHLACDRDGALHWRQARLSHEPQRLPHPPPLLDRLLSLFSRTMENALPVNAMASADKERQGQMSRHSYYQGTAVNL